MNDLKYKFGQYVFPGLLTIVGLLILITGVDQNWMFKLGGAAIAIVGIVSILKIAGIINQQISIVVMVVMILGSAGMAYLDYFSIDSRLKYLEKKDMIASHVIQRLKDIRTAQVAFHDAHDRYTANWDTLENFVISGEIPMIQAYGEKPDTLSEQEAIEMGLIVRDTVYKSVLESEFLAESALKQRKYPFHVDSLRYVPFSGGQSFDLEAGHILDASGIKNAVFKVEDPDPFAPPAFHVGSMEKVTVNGNWTE